MYRLYEIIPGALAWATLLGMVFFSWKLPTAVAIFIILFDIYWLLKTIYLSFHLRSAFSEMRANLKINWLERLGQIANGPEASLMESGNYGASKWHDIFHLVIFPMHQEPYGVVKESFSSLIATNYPKDKFIVVLATEERAGQAAQQTAKKIEQEFGRYFFKFLITKHPADLPGEIPGKGSNETWAVKKAKELIIDPLLDNPSMRGLSYQNILVSVLDVDSRVYPEYFSRLTYVFLTSENPWQAIYQPIPLFLNNIFQAPALARVVSFSASFWQMMQQARPERLTSFSSQSIPFTALMDIGFWQTDVVSEDSRIFWQGYLRYHGDFRVVPLKYPISMDANAAPTFWQTCKNIYKQQRRWGWGCENIPYLLDGFRKDPLIPGRQKFFWRFVVIEGFHSWATNALMIFALGWLPVFLGGEQFDVTLLSYGLPQITRWIMTFSMFGIATSAILSILLLVPRPTWFGLRHYFLYALQWLLIPVTLIIFGALPGLEAQTRLMFGGRFRLGFWVTPKSLDL